MDLNQPAQTVQTETQTQNPSQSFNQTPLSNNWIKIIAVFLFIIIIGGGGYYLGQISKLKSQSSNPIKSDSKPQLKTQSLSLSSTPTPDPTANWKTYTNTKYGFSLNYPNGWQIVESNVVSPDKVKFYPPEADLTPDPKNPMKFLNRPSIGVYVLTRNFTDSPKGDLGDLSTTNGLKGNFYQTSQCAPKCSYNFDLPYEGGLKTFSIQMTSDGNLELFKQIISSFKFTQ